MNRKDFVTIIMYSTISDSEICDCRCYSLSDAMCESRIRYSISFKNDLCCYLCTDSFCMKNMNDLNLLSLDIFNKERMFST